MEDSYADVETTIHTTFIVPFVLRKKFIPRCQEEIVVTIQHDPYKLSSAASHNRRLYCHKLSTMCHLFNLLGTVARKLFN